MQGTHIVLGFNFISTLLGLVCCFCLKLNNIRKNRRLALDRKVAERIGLLVMGIFIALILSQELVPSISPQATLWIRDSICFSQIHRLLRYMPLCDEHVYWFDIEVWISFSDIPFNLHFV